VALDAVQCRYVVGDFYGLWKHSLSSGAHNGVIAMLEQLLNEIRAGGTLETNALAVRLGVSPQMMQAMLEHLQRSGHIRLYSSCSEGCQGCGLRSSCNIEQRGGQVRLWQDIDEPPISSA
jgi:FeoC-like transcriptional regulator